MIFLYMYLLDEKKLRKGDIILLRFDDRKSEMIRNSSNSKFSHAMLYVGALSLIDSDGPGVHAHNLQRVLIPSIGDALVLRASNATIDQLGNVELFVRSKVGTQYSMQEARKVLRNSELVPEDNRQFCTRLVAKAYEFSGVNIVGHPDYCSPKDIEDSLELIEVQNPLRKANEKEIEYANETDTPLTIQTNITNDILEKMRQVTGSDIQTLEQANDYLLEYPEHDAEFTKIVHESGYLNMWETDTKKNPWHYDYGQFTKHYPESQFTEVGKSLVAQCKELFARFTIMRDYYEANKLKLGYFDQMHALYIKLLELNKQRLEVAVNAMSDGGLSSEEIDTVGQL